MACQVTLVVLVEVDPADENALTEATGETRRFLIRNVVVPAPSFGSL